MFDSLRSRLVLYAVAATLAVMVAVGVFMVSDRLAREHMKPLFPDLPDAPFVLQSASGGEISNEDLVGKSRLLFFGFTHCPDICPATIYNLTNLIDRIGAEDGIGLVFVSVDPERDTVPILADYMSNFDDRVIALTGDSGSVDILRGHYRVYAEKVPLDGEDYTVDHTATVFLFDRKGRYSGVIGWGENEAVAAEKIRRLLQR